MKRKEPFIDIHRATVPASCLTLTRLTHEQRAYITKRGITWNALDEGKRSDILHYINDIRQEPSTVGTMFAALGEFFGRIFMAPAPVPIARRA